VALPLLLVPRALDFMSHAEREVILAAVAQNPNLLRFATQHQGDRDIVLAAVARNGGALQHAGALRADLTVVLVAVAQDATAAQYASPAVRRDRRVQRMHLMDPRINAPLLAAKLRLSFMRCLGTDEASCPLEALPLDLLRRIGENLDAVRVMLCCVRRVVQCGGGVDELRYLMAATFVNTDVHAY
jgi:hypothetical protein